MQLHFAQPFWIVIGSFFCLLVFGYLRFSEGKRRQALALFASPRISGSLTRNVSRTRRGVKKALFISGLFFCFLALARPQYGETWVEVKQKGIDILVALDTSRSMLAQDTRPNRLERAKLAIKDFAASLNGDRIGLMPFAGTSFLMCPLTTDYAAFDATLDAISPDTLPVGGTDLAGVINTAESVLAGEANHKILVLVTDGEGLEGSALEAARKAADHKVTIYTVGVGTPEGELIPDGSGNQGSYIKDTDGNFVRSQLDETELTKIAEITGGMYVPLGSTGQGFTTIYEQKLELVPKEEHQERLQSRPIERFYWPLAFALILFTVEFLLSGRKSARSFKLPRIKTAGRRLFKHKELLIVLLYPLLNLPTNANGLTADEFFHTGKFEEAEQEYQKHLDKDPDNAVLHFNLGDTQYRKKDYDKAASSFKQALQSDDLGLQAKSYYNLGNAQYRMGQATLSTDPEHTIELYQQAIDSYSGSLQLNPEDGEAKHNREVVEKELEQLKTQQEQKQNEQEKQDNSKQEDKKQQNKSGQDKENGDQKQNQKDQQSGDKDSQNQQSQGQQSQENQPRQQGAQGQQSADEEKQDQQPPQENSPSQKDASEPDSAKDNQQGKQAENQTEHNKSGNTSPGQTDARNNQDNTGQASAAAAGKAKKEDAERRQLGKMTTQEAKGLLDALQEEEGRLDFVPQAGETTGEQPLKNW